MTIDLTNNGWIKLHRKFTDWEWYNHLPTKVLFLHLILTANHKEAKWQGKTILRGQKITSLSNLALEAGLSVQQIRTAISNLKSTGEITQLVTANYSLISIINYDKYQHINTLDNTPSTHEQQAINTPSTTNKNENKEKNEKNNIMFEEFWQNYIPIHTKKGNKKTCLEKYQAILNKGANHETIMEGLKKYMAHCKKTNTYTKNVIVWLNQQCWQDEYEPVKVETAKEREQREYIEEYNRQEKEMKALIKAQQEERERELAEERKLIRAHYDQ